MGLYLDGLFCFSHGPGRGGPPPRGPPFHGPPGRGGHMPRDGYQREGYRDGYDYDSRMDGRGDGPWRGRGDYQRGPPRGGRGGPYHNRVRRDSYQSGEDEYEEDLEHERRDPYANLMSQREKEWIIKIQLMQLHTDNPYVDDYYFTVSNKCIVRIWHGFNIYSASVIHL